MSLISDSENHYSNCVIPNVPKISQLHFLRGGEVRYNDGCGGLVCSTSILPSFLLVYFLYSRHGKAKCGISQIIFQLGLPQLGTLMRDLEGGGKKLRFTSCCLFLRGRECYWIHLWRQNVSKAVFQYIFSTPDKAEAVVVETLARFWVPSS